MRPENRTFVAVYLTFLVLALALFVILADLVFHTHVPGIGWAAPPESATDDAVIVTMLTLFWAGVFISVLPRRHAA